MYKVGVLTAYFIPDCCILLYVFLLSAVSESLSPSLSEVQMKSERMKVGHLLVCLYTSRRKRMNTVASLFSCTCFYSLCICAQRSRVSVSFSVGLCVIGYKNEHFERSRPAYEPDLQSQKWKDIGLYGCTSRLRVTFEHRRQWLFNFLESSFHHFYHGFSEHLGG